MNRCAPRYARSSHAATSGFSTIARASIRRHTVHELVVGAVDLFVRGTSIARPAARMRAVHLGGGGSRASRLKAPLCKPKLPAMGILPTGFIPPCLPMKAPRPLVAGDWLHEIKHDGFRIIARKAGTRVRLYSRPGNDLTPRFPLIVEALAGLRSRSCFIDGEAVACGDDGMASFDAIPVPAARRGCLPVCLRPGRAQWR